MVRSPTSRPTSTGARRRRCVTRSPRAALSSSDARSVDDRAQRHDVQHALTVAQEVDDLVAGLHEHGLAAVEHEVRGREVGAELRAQVLDRLARGLQRDVGVEQALDDLQLDEIAVRVEALRAAAVRVAHRRTHEIGAGPVVELAVRDADDLADERSAIAVAVASYIRAPPSRRSRNWGPQTGRPVLRECNYIQVRTVNVT